jgi:hypothetical protein
MDVNPAIQYAAQYRQSVVLDVHLSDHRALTALPAFLLKMRSLDLRRMDAVRMHFYDRQVMDMLSALPL